MQLKSAEARLAINQEYPKARERIADLLPKKAVAEQAYQSVKADLDSISSFYDIQVDEHGPTSEKAKDYYTRIQDLKKQVEQAQSKKDQISAELKDLQVTTDLYEGPLTQAISNWKKVTDKFDAQVKLAINKKWGFGDAVRAFPVIDAFNSPIRIQQFTINDIPIDYNFKTVTRFDRCMTCHQGIDRPAFSKGKLKELTRVSSEYDQKLINAHEMIKRRNVDLEGLPEAKSLPNWRDLQLTEVAKSELTDARVNEYCATRGSSSLSAPIASTPPKSLAAPPAIRDRVARRALRWPRTHPTRRGPRNNGKTSTTGKPSTCGTSP